ncbi:MAG: hypothetical protein H6710_02295 [Myxococcales bacterium]|nr:hypothetical protein [Myxococcales bacterium]MCB9702773.1 hypothetical protein [Myxococcales bacterium]
MRDHARAAQLRRRSLLWLVGGLAGALASASAGWLAASWPAFRLGGVLGLIAFFVGLERCRADRLRARMLEGGLGDLDTEGW